MYKVTITHLEQLRKALVDSNKKLSSVAANNLLSEPTLKVYKQNEKAIKLIDDEYLNPKV